MKVLTIGSDRSLFVPQSESAKRQIAYSTHFENLDIIVFSLRSQQCVPRTLATGLHVYPTNSRSRLWYGFDAIRIARRLPKPEVISAQDPFEAGLVALCIARMLRVPLHVQVHTDLYAPAFREHSLLNRIRLHIARFVLPRATRIRVVSPRIKHSLLATGYRLPAISILPIFVDTERFRSAKPGELTHRFRAFKTKILVVARLESEKNVALAINSFKHAAPKDACLIIVGEGSERARLEHLKTERIFFESAQDPAPYYALADLVLVTSTYEGYGLTIIEALAAGKPVLSTDVGIASEAGALIARDLASGVRTWFQSGPHKGILRNYPYESFESYVKDYCDDIAATKK